MKALFLPLMGLIIAFQTDTIHAQERRQVPEFRVVGNPSQQTRAAIDQLLANYKKAWGEENTEALMTLHRTDTEWINAYARMFRNKSALGKFLRGRLFPEFEAGVSQKEAENMRTISMRFIGECAVVVHLYTEGERGPSRNADETSRRTHLHLILEKTGTQWLVAHTAIMDAR